MYKRPTSLRNSVGGTLSALVFVWVLLALTACGPETLVVGLEPTPSATPLPTPVVQSYVNNEFGFTFRYPETWTLGEKPRLITLSRGALTLYIGYGWASDPGAVGARTGVPAGDFVYADKVFFLEQMIPARALVYEGKDKMVLYGETGLVEIGDLVFSIWLEDLVSADYSELDIPEELQAEVKEILESFERIAASGEPADPTPSPTPTVEQHLITYVNDEYRLALIYPPSWELEEIPAGASASAIHLTRGALRLAIQFKRLEEATALGASGRPAGEIEERGAVTVLGREIPKRVLVHEGRVKSVFLGDRFDDLELYVQLDDGVGTQMAYEEIDIPEVVQAEMDAILGGLTRTGELPSSGPDALTYENRTWGFSFQHPATWTVEEIVGETMEDGVKLADAVVLSQEPFRIVVQYQRKSDPAPVAWGGSFVPGGLGYAEATLGDRVTLLGEETHKHIWAYDGGIKAIAVNTTGQGADLVLSITLADGRVRVIQDAEAATVPESALAALDQILSSFALTQ